MGSFIKNLGQILSRIKSKRIWFFIFKYIFLFFVLTFLIFIWCFNYYTIDMDLLKTEIETLMVISSPNVPDSEKILFFSKHYNKDISQVNLSKDYLNFIVEFHKKCNMIRDLKISQLNQSSKLVLETFPFFIYMIFLYILFDFLTILVNKFFEKKK